WQDVKISPLVVIAKALLVAIRRNPEVNASWDEKAGEIVYKHFVNLGIAAATPRGLIVPNVKDAHLMTLRELAEGIDDLAKTARAGRTALSDTREGTITITNFGVFGIDSGTPILNPGESVILGVGAIKEKPWVVDGQVVPRQIAQLALSFDHRLIDGALGSELLRDISAVLEDPRSGPTALADLSSSDRQEDAPTARGPSRPGLSTWQTARLVAAGGGVGAALRLIVTVSIPAVPPPTLVEVPWATLWVNLIGC